MRLRSRPTVAVLALIVCCVVAGLAPAAATAAPGPLPDCSYQDVPTPRGQYGHWDKTLLDTALMVGKDYVPPNLESTARARIAGGGLVRRLVIENLRLMRRAAADAGNPIEVTSAYRDYERQRRLFDAYVDVYGYERTLARVARPGHSEHQLGTALDFKTKGGRDPWLLTDWATTPAGAWLKANAWKFGFVMSYPKGKRSVTCYGYEPWHYRYFGRDVARAIHDSGVTARQWLWRQGYGGS